MAATIRRLPTASGRSLNIVAFSSLWGRQLTCLIAVVLATAVSVSALADDTVDKDGFRPLFNGRDLSGWVPVNTAPDTWSVEDGRLVCSGKPIGELRTDRMFQNFILEVEWRHMVPRGNAGIFVWADDITSRGVPFHRSIEVQVLENAYGNTRGYTTHGDIFPIHGAKMTPVNGRGGSRAFPTENRSNPSPEWNHYRIECRDGEISLAVNGKVVTRGHDASPRKGYICIESEGGVVHYRNMRIKELPDTDIDPEHVAIANRGYRSIYTGTDLSGWELSTADTPLWHSRDWVLDYEGTPDRFQTLKSKQHFKDYGFVFDVRPGENSGPVALQLRGTGDTAIPVSLEHPQIGKHLEPAGRWNRIEGTIRGNRITVQVNSHPEVSWTMPDGSAEAGPLILKASGPTGFANVFVRDLAPAK